QAHPGRGGAHLALVEHGVPGRHEGDRHRHEQPPAFAQVAHGLLVIGSPQRVMPRPPPRPPRLPPSAPPPAPGYAPPLAATSARASSKTAPTVADKKATSPASLAGDPRAPSRTSERARPTRPTSSAWAPSSRRASTCPKSSDVASM